MVVQNVLSTAMNARIVGSGKETIVLAHGFGGDQTVWEKVLPYLAKCYKVVVFDWSFAGTTKDPTLFDAVRYSSYDGFADDLVALMDELSFKSSVFVGHSMSGMIGCIASIKRPDLFKKLILVTASPRYLNLENYIGGFEISDIEHIFSFMESNYEQWAAGFAASVLDQRDPHSVNLFEQCLKRMSPQVALPLAKTIFLSDQRGILCKIITPCTIVQTTNDIVVPNSVPNYMQDNIIAKSTLEFIDADGHFPQLTAHVRFLEVLDRALK